MTEALADGYRELSIVAVLAVRAVGKDDILRSASKKMRVVMTIEMVYHIDFWSTPYRFFSFHLDFFLGHIDSGARL